MATLAMDDRKRLLTARWSSNGRYWIGTGQRGVVGRMITYTLNLFASASAPRANRPRSTPTATKV
jgi:hypothetical protein